MSVFWPVQVSAALFAGMAVCLGGGYRLGLRRVAAGRYRSLGTVEGAILALLGLLLGFAFAGATSRFESRRDQIVQEANAIGTAYLRLDLVPQSDQPDLRRLFRTYLETRLRIYGSSSDPASAEPLFAEVGDLQQKIWTRAVQALSHDDANAEARLLVLPALNEMIDITTTRKVAATTRIPSLILGLLVSVALLSALLAGFGMAETGRSWLHVLLYAVAVTLTIYTVLDLDNPRAGLIRLDGADKALTELLQSIG
ncbi:MAG TPA: hypothetical protein VFV95_10080 [Vicinamibacterales bacterium]|nr:hypothetical protein [Vicinamibacterales bacterium]